MKTSPLPILLFSISLIWSIFISIGAYNNSNINNTLFQFHPPLMSFGFFFFLHAGILSFVDNLNRNIHIILQTLGSICILAGFLIVIIAKSLANEPHFKTSHSVIGLCAIIGVFIQFISGILKIKSNNIFLKQHGGFGIFTFLLGIASLLIACTVYLCGNITVPDIKGTYTCKNSDYDSMKYNVTLVLCAFFTIMLYINFPRNKKLNVINNSEVYQNF